MANAMACPETEAHAIAMRRGGDKRNVRLQEDVRLWNGVLGQNWEEIPAAVQDQGDTQGKQQQQADDLVHAQLLLERQLCIVK